MVRTLYWYPFCEYLIANPLVPAPSPPSITSVTSPSSTSLRIEWESVNDAIGYNISFLPVGGACDGVEGGSVLVTDGDATSHTLLRLEEFTEYEIEVRSQGADGLGTPSDPVSETTLQDGVLAVLRHQRLLLTSVSNNSPSCSGDNVCCQPSRPHWLHHLVGTARVQGHQLRQHYKVHYRIQELCGE